MDATDRMEKRRQRTRERLMDAAEQVFSQLGYEAATVLDVTEAADVSKRTFYLHFNDKEAVIEALALRRFQALRAQIEEKEQFYDENQRVGLHWTLQAIFEFAEQSPELMQIIFGMGGSFRLQSLVREYMARAWEENFLEHCDWRADAPVPPVVLANVMAGTVFQTMCWWVKHPGTYSAQEMAAMVTSALHDGVIFNMLSAKMSGAGS